MKKVTLEIIRKVVMDGIEANVDESAKYHSTGPDREPWNKKELGGRRTRGVSPEEWRAHCNGMACDELRSDANPAKKRVKFTGEFYSTVGRSVHGLEKHL